MHVDDTTSPVCVPLSDGTVTWIDAEDAERVLLHRWHHVPSLRTSYARSTDGIYLHRFITDAAPRTHVDHRDNDGLNNRRANLRVCTALENHANQRVRCDSKSGYKGVWRNPDRTRWKARIVVSGKKINARGTFATPEEAAHAYDAMAREHYGEFAWLNFPDHD